MDPSHRNATPGNRKRVGVWEIGRSLILPPPSRFRVFFHSVKPSMKIHHNTGYGIEEAYGHHAKTVHPRTPGIHVSGIIRQLAVQHGLLKGELEQETMDLIRLTRFVCGYAWEDWIAKRIPNLIHQPGECELDGVWMSPDGLVVDESGITLHEMKFTTTSSARPIQDRTMWLWQCMSYLAGLSKKFGERVTVAVIHPLYVNGDYRERRYPIYQPVRLEFEWAEIEANWELMLAWKDRAVAE
jgi:hypothetical protein